MKRTALIALGLLLALAVGVRGEFRVGNPSAATTTNYSTLESRLGLTKHQLALQRRPYEPKGGVCFFFDDCDTSFFTDVIVVADSIHAARGWDDNTRIRATTGVMVNNVGTGASATWAQIESIKDRPDEFEVALHGNSSERYGSVGAGKSRARADSMLGAHQDSIYAHMGYYASGVMLPNHRTTLAYQNLFSKHGISWVAGLRVPLAQDTAFASSGGPLSNEQSPMDVNYDPWPAMQADKTQADFACFQRHGGINNRWNIGRRDSWKNSNDSLQIYKDCVSLAAHTSSMVLFTNHTVGDTTGAGAGATGSTLDLRMSRQDLVDIFDFVADLIDSGYVESLTGSQMADRGTGYVVGRLNPTHEWALINDFDSSADLPSITLAPFGFPLKTDGQNFYQSGDTLTSLAGDTYRWKVANADTVDSIYAAEGLADSVSYGATSPNKRVLIASATSARTYRTDTFPIIIRTTGVQSDHIELTIQALTYGGESDDFAPMIRLLQFDENTGDFVNSAVARYDFVLQAAKTSTYSTIGSPDKWSPVATALNPQFDLGFVDSLLPTSGATYDLTFPDSTVTVPTHNLARGASDSEREFFVFSKNLVKPYVIESQGAIDRKLPFGNYADLEASGDAGEGWMVNVVTARDQIINNNNYGRAYWITYLFRVPIVPNSTDWVAGHVYWRYIGDAPAATIDVVVSDVAAWAPY